MAKHPKGYNVEGDPSSGRIRLDAPTKVMKGLAQSKGKSVKGAVQSTAAHRRKKRRKSPKQLVQEFIKTGKRST